MKNTHEVSINDEGIKDFVAVKKFLTKLTSEFPEKCKKYFDVTNEQVYIFSEIQLHTILVPILDKISKAFLVECPTDRQEPNSHEIKNGWIDYWIKYDDKHIFLIELKYSFSSLKDIKSYKKIEKEWTTANKQLAYIPEDTDFSVDNEEVIKIALQFNLTYDGSKIDKNYSLKECIEVGESIKSFINDIEESITPNFIFNWSVDERMIEHMYDDGTIQNYPYVHLFARVYKD